MLVTFRCGAYANVTIAADIAKRFLKMMGHSGTVPGVISAKDVSMMVVRLTNGVKAKNVRKHSSLPSNIESDASDNEAVRLAQIALPLIELLTAAAKENCNVMWEAG
jgi:hypothetical protein